MIGSTLPIPNLIDGLMNDIKRLSAHKLWASVFGIAIPQPIVSRRFIVIHAYIDCISFPTMYRPLTFPALAMKSKPTNVYNRHINVAEGFWMHMQQSNRFSACLRFETFLIICVCVCECWVPEWLHDGRPKSVGRESSWRTVSRSNRTASVKCIPSTAPKSVFNNTNFQRNSRLWDVRMAACYAPCLYNVWNILVLLVCGATPHRTDRNDMSTLTACHRACEMLSMMAARREQSGWTEFIDSNIVNELSWIMKPCSAYVCSEKHCTIKYIPTEPCRKWSIHLPAAVAIAFAEHWDASGH